MQKALIPDPSTIKLINQLWFIFKAESIEKTIKLVNTSLKYNMKYIWV